MAKVYWIVAPLLVIGASSAQAAQTKLPLNTKLRLASEQTNYSSAFGKRHETTVESISALGATSLTLSGTFGKRDFGAASASAVRLAGAVHHDWSRSFSTRTSIAVSQNKPVFATREIAQDVSFKPISRAVVTVGAKYSRYFDSREALAWSAGTSYYFAGGLASYRFTLSDITGLGKSHSHLASFRLKDGRGAGSTQLWLGSGSSLREQLQFATPRDGKFRSVSIQRVQPLYGPVALNLGLGRTWYQTEDSRYHGTALTFGLTATGWPKF